ncbi:MAG: hypothetical protein ACOY5C_00285 [Pseudomonadota bacterium]
MDSIKTLRARAVLLAQEAADLANSKEVVWARIAFTFLFALTLLVGAIEPAWAAGDAGATLAQGFRNLFYGVWGFVIGIILVVAACGFMKMAAGITLLIRVKCRMKVILRP